MTASFLYGVYCDDIRQEVGNKQTLVGIYSGNELVFDTPFPAILPKLCVSAAFIYPKDELPKQVDFTISLEGNILVRASVVPQADNQRSIFEGLDDGFPRRSQIQANFFLGPLAVEKESILRLEANVDGTRYFGPRLSLRSESPKEAGEPQ